MDLFLVINICFILLLELHIMMLMSVASIHKWGSVFCYSINWGHACYCSKLAQQKNISCCQTFQIVIDLLTSKKNISCCQIFQLGIVPNLFNSKKKHFLLPNIPDSNSFQITFSLRSSAFEGVSFMVLKMTYIYNNQY